MKSDREGARAGRGCGVGCLIFVLLFLGLIALLVFGVLALLGSEMDDDAETGTLWHRSGKKFGRDDYPEMHEVWASGNGDTKVVRVPVNGLIRLGEDSWYAGSANSVLRSIRRATHDEKVQGLILELNSGGGGITDSDIIYRALLDFKEAQPKRVIVALLGDVAASGAYYIALAADKIVAHPTTITGSIGVIMQSYNIKELAAKLGIQDVTIKSGVNKDLLNPFQEPNPEQEALMQQIISAMHARFMNLVAQHRNLPLEKVEKLADGRIFLASEALENGLIDAIGYRAEAQDTLAGLLEVEGVKVYSYSEQLNFKDLLFGGTPGIGLESKIKQALGEAGATRRLMYLWHW